jgi:hypothetical protein
MNGRTKAKATRNGAIAQLPIIRQKHEQSQPGIGQGRNRETAEQEHGDRRAPLAGGDAIENHRRCERSHESGERQRFERQGDAGRGQITVAHDDHGRGCERCSARYADQRGIGERIAEQALHHRAASGQQAADDDRKRNAGQSDRPEHQPIAIDECRVAGRKPERGGDAAERDACGADGCGDGGRQQKNDEQHRRHQHAHRPAPCRSARCARCNRFRHCRQSCGARSEGMSSLRSDASIDG